MEQAGCYDEIILLDKEEQIGKTVGSYVISGTDEELSRFYQEGCRELFITVGSIKDTKTRHRLAEQAIGLGFRLINIIDPSAAVSDMVQMGTGNFIGKLAVVNAGSIIEDMTIVNSGAVVEHDCRIGSYSHIACGSILCGGVTIGADCLIGAGTTVIQGITIGNGSIIGAGSLILKDVEPGSSLYGVHH